MKLKTIFLKDNRIVTIDEDAEIKDCFYLVGKDGIWHTNKCHPNVWNGITSKIIASYPKLEGVPEYESLPIEDDVEKYHGNTLSHWKQNAEENYVTTPISVLKYITVLEEAAKKEGCFTKEDLRQAFEHGFDANRADFDYENGETVSGAFNHYLSTLKQPEWEFVVEMECCQDYQQTIKRAKDGSMYESGYSTCCNKKEPKIINNKIQGVWKKV